MSNKTIAIGSDHAGFELKEKILTHLTDKGHEVIDHGAKTYNAADDYPVFCFLAAQAVAKDSNSLAMKIAASPSGFVESEKYFKALPKSFGYLALIARSKFIPSYIAMLIPYPSGLKG